MVIIGTTNSAEAHIQTKVFQTLRIFVNNELNELNYGLSPLGPSCCHDMVTADRDAAGLLAALSFYSLEDKLVKGYIMGRSNQPTFANDLSDYSVIEETKIDPNLRKWKFYRERLFFPTEKEVMLNPRARSAKLRLAVRLATSNTHI